MKEKGKIMIGLIIGILLMLPVISAEYEEGQFWSRVDDTIVLTNSSHNVHIGKNESIPILYRFLVQGVTKLNGSLLVTPEGSTFLTVTPEEGIETFTTTSFHAKVVIDTDKPLIFCDAQNYLVNYGYGANTLFHLAFAEEGLFKISTTEPIYDTITKNITTFSNDTVDIHTNMTIEGNINSDVNITQNFSGYICSYNYGQICFTSSGFCRGAGNVLHTGATPRIGYKMPKSGSLIFFTAIGYPSANIGSPCFNISVMKNNGDYLFTTPDVCYSFILPQDYSFLYNFNRYEYTFNEGDVLNIYYRVTGTLTLNYNQVCIGIQFD